MKVIVCGSRGFSDYALMKRKLDHYLSNKWGEGVEIVSGGANGADKLGELYSKERGLDLKIMNADWDTYGKSAGIRRNEQMGAYADAVVAFWDGKSRGTKHMIEYAQKHEMPLRVVYYEK